MKNKNLAARFMTFWFVVQRELKHVAFVLHIWYHGVSNALVLIIRLAGAAFSSRVFVFKPDERKKLEYI